MHLAEIPTGYAEINDDGTWVHHPFKFQPIGDDIIKITYDKTTGCVLRKEIYEPYLLVTADAISGDVMQVQRGFVLDHEIRLPVAPAGQQYIAYRASELPDDFLESRGEDRVFVYRWNVTEGEWRRRSAEEIDAAFQAILDARTVDE